MDTENLAGISESSGLLPAEEKLLPQSQVNELVGREKQLAAEKVRREMQAQIDALRTGQQQSMGGMQMPNVDEMYNAVSDRLRGDIQKAQEEARKAGYENFVKAQVDSYLTKMERGSGLADDFREMTAKFKPDKFKEVFYLANSFDNTPAIIYELSKNPLKLMELHNLAQTDPDWAKSQMENLSKSIQMNEQAKATNRTAEPPLSRPKPSLAAGADNGAMSVADFKRAPWLRG